MKNNLTVDEHKILFAAQARMIDRVIVNTKRNWTCGLCGAAMTWAWVGGRREAVCCNPECGSKKIESMEADAR